jgi:hypothetical protein
MHFVVADWRDFVVRRLRGLSASTPSLTRRRIADLQVLYDSTDSVRGEAFVRVMFFIG